MRRTGLTTFMMVMLLASLGAAPAVSPWGAGMSFSGASRVEVGGQEPEASSVLSLSIYASPWDLPVFNPSVRGSMDIRFSNVGTELSGFSGVLGLDIIRTLDHPFGWLVTNRAMWAPLLELGTAYKRGPAGSSWALHMAVVPFRLAHRDFIYEWFGVYADMRTDTWRVDEWGILLYRGTVLL